MLDEALEAAMDYESMLAHLDADAVGVIRDMEKLRRYLKQYGSPSNSLGALQLRGVEVDRLCGELDVQRKRFAVLVRLANEVLEEEVRDEQV